MSADGEDDRGANRRWRLLACWAQLLGLSVLVSSRIWVPGVVDGPPFLLRESPFHRLGRPGLPATPLGGGSSVFYFGRRTYRRPASSAEAAGGGGGRDSRAGLRDPCSCCNLQHPPLAGPGVPRKNAPLAIGLEATQDPLKGHPLPHRRVGMSACRRHPGPRSTTPRRDRNTNTNTHPSNSRKKLKGNGEKIPPWLRIGLPCLAPALSG